MPDAGDTSGVGLFDPSDWVHPSQFAPTEQPLIECRANDHYVIRGNIEGEFIIPGAEIEDESPLSPSKLTLSTELLGEGSCAVFAAEWTDRGQSELVAAKRIPFDVDITNELDVLRTVQHSNVVIYHALERVSSDNYIVLERCDCNLLEAINAGPGSELDARALCIQMVSAVAYLHSIGIAHRNLKPQNCLIKVGAIKLSDFGLSKMVGHGVQAASHNGGSVGWVPPEILTDGAVIDQLQADIFPLGCLQHFILTAGGHPFGRNVSKMALGESDLSALDVVAVDLVRSMLDMCPGSRPSAESCLRHPMFWSSSSVVELCLRLREALGFSEKDAKEKIKKEAKEKLKASQEAVVKTTTQLDKIKDKPNVPATRKAKMQLAVDTSKKELTNLELEAGKSEQEAILQVDALGSGLVALRQSLEGRVKGPCYDFLKEATKWAAKIPKPPGPHGAWTGDGPKVWGQFPVFSLVIFVRNAAGHSDQAISQGVYTSKKQMNDFFLENFPWLPLVLYKFVEVDLRRMVSKIDGMVATAMAAAGEGAAAGEAVAAANGESADQGGENDMQPHVLESRRASFVDILATQVRLGH